MHLHFTYSKMETHKKFCNIILFILATGFLFLGSWLLYENDHIYLTDIYCPNNVQVCRVRIDSYCNNCTSINNYFCCPNNCFVPVANCSIADVTNNDAKKILYMFFGIMFLIVTIPSVIATFVVAVNDVVMNRRVTNDVLVDLSTQ